MFSHQQQSVLLLESPFSEIKKSDLSTERLSSPYLCVATMARSSEKKERDLLAGNPPPSFFAIPPNCTPVSSHACTLNLWISLHLGLYQVSCMRIKNK